MPLVSMTNAPLFVVRAKPLITEKEPRQLIVAPFILWVSFHPAVCPKTEVCGVA